MTVNPGSKSHHPKAGLLSYLPAALVPYGELLRVHRALGYYLNTSPYVVGIAYSAATAPTKLPLDLLLDRLLLLTLWSFILRSAGCAWNDLIDVDIDRQISRTQSRPLARGAISLSTATIFTACLFALGCSLFLFLPRQCAFEAGIEVFFALLYPFGKRFTDHPQLILVNIAWAIPMAMHSLGVEPGSQLLSSICLCVFIATVIVLIDLVYSRQDTEEDLKVGVKSMAVRYRDCIDTLAYSLFAISTLALLFGGLLGGLRVPFVVFSVGGHIVGFWRFLRASLQTGPAGVESRAKSSCLMASVFWLLGLGIEYAVGSRDSPDD
ncbi:UbiA prenyltransferase family-domain-containing protein [Aspergillus pseudodeflectus]|uniref:UbiA prenyltransferase family-domain-containing protein n=1 Tax=Aspergillus pseudodeflectus TaxID=176178 RepID=A0ABR4JT42_9EURO